MLGAIKHGLGNLFNFSGRDARQTFWYYVLFIYLSLTAVTMLAMIPMFATMMSCGVAAAKSGASNEAVNAMMLGEVRGMFGSMIWISIASGLAMTVLLAASLVRRLHDSNLSGWWAVAPAAIQGFALAMMPRQIAMMEDLMRSIDPAKMNNPEAMMQMQGTGLIGWAAIGLVIWFGVRKSSEGANRFGDAPVRF